MSDLLVHVFEQCNRSAFLNDSVLKHFHSIDSSRLGAATHIAQLVDNNETIGLASMQAYPEYEEVHITFVEVAKTARGYGYGREVLVGVFDLAAKIAQEVDETVSVTVGGFTQKGERSILPALRDLALLYAGQNVVFDYTP